MPEGVHFILLNVTDPAGMLFIRVKNGCRGKKISSPSRQTGNELEPTENETEG